MTWWEWDVWPADTARPRVAMGNADSTEKAQRAVETVLAADDGALLGTVSCLYGRPLICRRGREPGSYVWRELDPAQPASAGN
jgi:hypothetical protein